MTSELEQQLQRLDARDQDLAETAALPRGALPALFRALADATPELQRSAAQRLAERLPDWPLVAPTLACLREHALEDAWAEAVLNAAEVSEPWCCHTQAAALLRLTPEAPQRGLDLLALQLSEQATDPTALALELGVEATTAALLEVLRLRLRGSASRRDRTSARLAQGAIRALAAIAADDPEVQRAVSQIVAAETRRSDKGQPVLALEALDALSEADPEALDALSEADPVARIRLLTPTLATLRTMKRRAVRERAEALRQAAADELCLGDEGLAELTARSGGLDRHGVARLPLDEGAEAELRFDDAGQIAVTAPAQLDREDTRALEAARRELQDARDELARRLELALATGRCWPVAVWRAVFEPHPLWRDLAARLTWELIDADGALTPFDLSPAPTTVFDEPLELPRDGAVRLLHPAEADPDELELWRERSLERGRPAPFPQLFRAVLPPAEDPWARYLNRQAHRDEVGELARRSGWRGYPLEGKPPWELWRAWPDGAEVALALDDVPPELARTALGNLTREARKLSRTKQGPAKDAKPRVRLTGVTVRGDGSARALAEAAKDLDALTDGLSTPSDLELRAWQQNKWRDPKTAWRELVLSYRQGSPGVLAIRQALLRLHRPELRLEDRFAITKRHVIELGTGTVHEGVDKDYLPAWKASERSEEAHLALRLPFTPDADPDTVRVVRLVLGLAAWEQQQQAEATE
jgi:hypothetical protein